MKRLKWTFQSYRTAKIDKTYQPIDILTYDLLTFLNLLTYRHMSR